MSKKHPHKHTTVKKPKPNHFWAVFFISIIICAYWIGSLFLNAYRYPSIEQARMLLWLPMVICISCLPVYIFVHLNKEHFSKNSIYWVLVGLLVVTGLIILISRLGFLS
ncbi:MAG: hypothetical protein NTZ19_13365 [Bacteroidetes bacterium]|nr:hypothetical protein [Bacteroidota bacterium]